MQVLSGKTKTWTMMRTRRSSPPSLSKEEEEGQGGGRGIDGGGTTAAAKGVAAGALPSPTAPAAPLSGPTSGEAAVGAVGDGCRNGALPGRPSRIPGPEPGGRAAGGGGGKCNGPSVPSPPRCCTAPPAPPPGWADSDDGDDGTRAEAQGNAGNGNPLGINNAAAATIAGKADNVGQENNDHGGDDGDNDEDDDKWGRGM
jgi:hypothetical protein